jgi:hypothetical protein
MTALGLAQTRSGLFYDGRACTRRAARRAKEVTNVRGFLAIACFAATAACSFAQCIPTSRSPRIETFATIKAIAEQGEAGS